MSVHRPKLIQGLCLAGSFLACSAAAQGEGQATTRSGPAASVSAPAPAHQVSLTGATAPWIETGPGGCARDVGLLGGSFQAEISAFLTGAGHTVSIETAASIGAGSLAALDVLYILRDGSGAAATVAATIEAWVRGGGVLITEFDSTVQLLDGVTYGMFSGATLDNGFAIPSGSVCGGNDVNIVAPGNPLATGLGAGWSCSGDPIGVLKVFNETTLDPDLDIAARIKLDQNGDGILDAVAGTACVDDGTVVAFFTDFSDWQPLENPRICPNPSCMRSIQDETLLNNAVCLALGGCAQEHPCPWDCAVPHNKAIDVIDFLALLGGWGFPGPCDFDGNGVVDVLDFLKLLSQWGPCPTPANDECPGTAITRSEPVGVIEVHFDMYGATASPFPYQCFPAPPIFKDIWYCLIYQPLNDIKKNVRISTTVPLGIEVTAGCLCPPGPLVACGFGVEGTPQFSMQPGDAVLIRLVNVQQLPNDLLKGLLIIENKIPPPPPTNFFEDPGQFFQALEQTEKLQKFFWDFKPHDNPTLIPGLNGPLDINTHGLDPDDVWTDPAGANLWPPFVDNVQFNSNMSPQGPFTPRNIDALAFAWPGNFPVNNNALVANFFVDSFEIVSGPPAGDNHTAFALDILSLAGPLPTLIHVTVYDKQDQELGKYVLQYDGGKRFLGILTKDQVTIGRIDIWDVNGGAEGVSALSAYAKNPFGCPGPPENECCQPSPSGLPGCNNVECCRRVCTIDPFCCDILWDNICANEAAQFPQCDCGCPPSKNDCCLPGDGTPGCNNDACCDRVCGIDPFCCDVAWDSICAEEALQFPQCGCNANACQPPGVCGTFQVCGIGTPFDCFCFEVDNNAAGPGWCIQDFFCDGTVCPPGGCPPGFVCVTNSCCGPSQCVPIVKCEPVPADAGPLVVPDGGGLTGSGAFFEATK